MRCLFGLCIVCVVACEATDPTPYTTGRDSTLGRCRLQPCETVVTSRPAEANWSDKPTARISLRPSGVTDYSLGVIPPTPLIERPPGRRLGSSETLLPTLVAERTISALLVPTDFHNDVGTPED